MLEHADAVRPELGELRPLLRRQLPGAHPRPLHGAEPIGHERVGLAGVVDHDRQNKRHARGDAPRPLGREVPFDAEIAFVPRLRIGRDNRDKQHTLLDLPTNLCVPLVARLQPALDVEPHLHPRRAQRLGDALGRLRVLRRVGKEDGFAFGGGHFNWSSARPIFRRKTGQRGSAWRGLKRVSPRTQLMPASRSW